MIMVLAIMLALWTASVSIADEIEGRTALTLLSKPVGRRQFILGKFLGILVPGGAHVPRPRGDFSGQRVVQGCLRRAGDRPCRADAAGMLNEMVQIAPGLALAFHGGRGADGHQRGHLHPAADAGEPGRSAWRSTCWATWCRCWPIRRSGRSKWCSFVANLLAAVLPVLEHFNISAGISTGQHVPWAILGLDRPYASSTVPWPCSWRCCCSRTGTWRDRHCTRHAPRDACPSRGA